MSYGLGFLKMLTIAAEMSFGKLWIMWARRGLLFCIMMASELMWLSSNRVDDSMVAAMDSKAIFHVFTVSLVMGELHFGVTHHIWAWVVAFCCRKYAVGNQWDPAWWSDGSKGGSGEQVIGYVTTTYETGLPNSIYLLVDVLAVAAAL